MKITKIPRTIRNLSRVYEIMKVVAKYGFDDVVGRIGLEGSWDTILRKVSFGRFGQNPETERLSTEERIRKIFEDLGSTYIKFGQILATRPDLIPMSLVHELRKLQDDVPPFEASAARADNARHCVDCARPVRVGSAMHVRLLGEFENADERSDYDGSRLLS